MPATWMATARRDGKAQAAKAAGQNSSGANIKPCSPWIATTAATRTAVPAGMRCSEKPGSGGAGAEESVGRGHRRRRRTDDPPSVSAR